MMDSWEAQTKELLNRVECEIQEIKADTEKRIATLQQRRSALEEALKTYQEMMGITSLESLKSLSVDDLRGKSLREMLALIASHNNGLLVARQAIKLMKEAKFFSNPSHADSIVYSILSRTPSFTKVSPGIYRLNHVEKAKSVTRGGIGLKKAVKELKKKNPQMTKEEVKNYLMQHGFDFQGKRPGNAVHMAWISLGYPKKDALQKEAHRLALLGIKEDQNKRQGGINMKCPCCFEYQGTPKNVANHIRAVFDPAHIEWLETEGFNPVELVQTGNWLPVIGRLIKIAETSKS